MPYPLTCFDHNPLGMNVTFLLSFQTSTPEQSCILLESGVEQLLSLHPFLAGDVIRQAELGPKQNLLQIDPDATESLLACPMLRTRHFPGDSIDNLHSKGTLAGPEEQQIMGRFSPLPIDMELSLPRRPIVRFQANVLCDGVVLAMTFHHGAMDGAGAARVLGLLACFCKEPGEVPLTSQFSDRQLRSKITSGDTIGEQDGLKFNKHYCGLGEWSALLAQDWSGFIKSRATELMTWRVTIPDEKVQYLQRICNATLQRLQAQEADDSLPKFLTKNDIVSALLALVLRQAESAYGPKTEMSIAVDMRSRFQPPSFENYLGNMVMVVYTPISPARSSPEMSPGPAWSQGELHENYCDEITRVAVHIRQGLLAVDAEYIDQAVAYLHSQPDWAEVGFRGVPIPLSSFRNFRIFGLDFGETLGHQPRGFQLYLPVLGGMCFILPRHQDGKTGLEPWDLHLTVSQEEHTIITQDPLFLWATGTGKGQ
ncbi:hypothetical protein HIM_00192 [Hirsutella minnesotensis 3608]|nr:hypothetical protein HIM_00192 [Hirsutella minnesotensis 3608]